MLGLNHRLNAATETVATLGAATKSHRLRQAIAGPEATALRTAATWSGISHEPYPFAVHAATTQRKLFLSAERANYRFFFFAKITFQLSL